MSNFTAPNFTFPTSLPSSPIFSSHYIQHFYISLLFQHLIFHLFSNTLFKGESKLRQKSWILTTLASLVMSVGSLPYLYDLFKGGFNFKALDRRTDSLSNPLSAFFVAYLVSDLGLGSIYYRKLINVASGWVHHTAYSIFFLYWAHRGWSHLAAMASIFELPTLVMGIASLHPPLRSNMAFTITFFATRVFFHLALLIGSSTYESRHAPSIDGSWGPTIFIGITYPMHLWWGYKCILSVRRRMAKRKLERKEKNADENSFAVAAGRFLNGLSAPDTSSALNTPATTPGSSGSGSAIPVNTNFSSTNPVHVFAKAASNVSSKPMNLVFPGRNKNKDQGFKDSSSSSASRNQPKNKGPFTAAVAPSGSEESTKEPFLAIRSPAETNDRARRLIADTVRSAWYRAPESWRRQFENEANFKDEKKVLTRKNSAGGGDSSTSGEEDEGRIPLDRKSRARRAVIKAVRRAINGRNPDGYPDQVGADNTLASIDFSSLVRRLPHEFWTNQEYDVAPFPVEREIPGGRRRRVIDNVKRRINIARRDVVVFD